MNKKYIALMIVVAFIAITGTAHAYTIGERGDHIVDLQFTLIEAGFDIPAITSGVARPGYFGPQTQAALTRYNARPVLGAAAGPDMPFRVYAHDGVTGGGMVSTSSTAATYTTNQRDFTGTPTFINWTANVNTTISLSGTSTHQYVPKLGDVAQIYIRNASTTATSNMKFVAVDSGVDLQVASTTIATTKGPLQIFGLDVARVTFIRAGTHLVTAIFEGMIEAD